MNKNNKILKISLVLIVVSALATLLVINKGRVDKPVFLMNYYDLGVYEHEGVYTLDSGSFNLQYISNIDDKRTVTGIKFKEAPNTEFFASEYDSWNGTISFQEYDYNYNAQNYGRYAVHTVNLSCPNLIYEGDLEKLILSEAEVEFSDGLKMDVDLGEIALYKEKETPVSLEGISISSSNEGESSMTLRIKENVKIEKIESTLFDKALDLFDFDIRYMNYDENKVVLYEEGANIPKNALITITSTYKGSNNILEDYKIYNLSPKIYIVNEHNDRYSFRYHNIRNYTPYYSYYGIYEYLKARGEL